MSTRVLIAEDDPVSRRILETTLEQWAYLVVSTSNGVEALEVLDGEDPPRVMVLDWMMPELDGLEVCKRVRRNPRLLTAHIIMLTALGRTEEVVTALDAGANDYITKPFERQELRARLGVGVRLAQLEAELEQRVDELEEALAHVKQLQGMLPICFHCKRIRADDQTWQQVEAYIQNHSEARFTHALCSDCLETHYPATGEEHG